ncbi:putative general transcription factor IIH polypeptide 2 [Neospora caninum Liverpool]|uniref:General transcription factor IIH polypeptide 2,putative n=1 Tax=Neospora caninum (strain Liverpool) TaxID=572307 RepID=F0V7K0_NEOCL|nr:putative general transcription factor IIH polypeptide 2 [Neospora caninum Liverpool]CBZ49691.1 putative general transcription factor IIH polypeptide 2 [Neospora caninum Liverpool]CEL64276.1 TPA: general transcription factor IIH polypeptide 2,putative [Neospora caninum Liverpool]|eukprot:XP_003879726.1 putative general transcription factor IIH polypeptide 2 [Neospora caninum Liverpool]
MAHRPAGAGGRDATAYPSVEEVLQELEGNGDAAAEEDLYGQYAWECEAERSWDQLVESSEGFVLLHGASGGADEGVKTRRADRRQQLEPQIKKGVIRSLVLLIDMSEAMREKDFRPDRLSCVCQLAEEFIGTFLLQNPLAQLAQVALIGPSADPIVTSRCGATRGDSPSVPAARSPGSVGTHLFSSNAEECIASLREKRKTTPGVGTGVPSLKNGLRLAKDLLACVPPYCTREVLILYGSLRTCDVGCIEETIADVKEGNICCNVICLAAEMHVLKKLCQETGGRHAVPLHREHLRSLLVQHTLPPAWSSSMQPSLVRMGFPSLKSTSTAALCSCHQQLTFSAYVCPQCGAKLCDIPNRCRCCFLHLVSPADISRSFHSLCPPLPFDPVADIPEAKRVCACCTTRLERGGSQCPDCGEIFCHDCDVYTHEQLRQCAFCVMRDITTLDDESVVGATAALPGVSQSGVSSEEPSDRADGAAALVPLASG